MLFSDCGFVVFDDWVQVKFFAPELMRGFIKAKVPVRMGLAYGSCNTVRFTSDTIDTFRLTRAIFYGTGVIRSTLAEKRGGKGCRIFVHPSAGNSLQEPNSFAMLLPIQAPTSDAGWELSYLHEKSDEDND